MSEIQIFSPCDALVVEVVSHGCISYSFANFVAVKSEVKFTYIPVKLWQSEHSGVTVVSVFKECGGCAVTFKGDVFGGVS